ncbi:hypothetical protein [Archangium lipolyticum]|nr:hypothetical protein [Archangium lipolyticum]
MGLSAPIAQLDTGCGAPLGRVLGDQGLVPQMDARTERTSRKSDLFEGG